MVERLNKEAIMEEKKYTMAELLAEFGDGFDKMEDEPQQEIVVEEKPKEEKKEVLKDITIKCKKCEEDFVWSVKDQEFYKEKGFFKPTICKNCRKRIKTVNNFHKEEV